MTITQKPLGRKSYGSIGHLPGSRMSSPSDKTVPEGQARICTQQVRDKHDLVYIQEKLDGSCCAVAKLDDGEIVALGRAGYLAESSPYEQHKVFAKWVQKRESVFSRMIDAGERIVGEWMLQAHGTLYFIEDAEDLFIPFDIMRGTERCTVEEVRERVARRFTCPRLVNLPHLLPSEPESAMTVLSTHLTTVECDEPEGVMYRVERHGKVDFLAKWVRPEKHDGYYLPEISGRNPVWNYNPEWI